MEKIAIIGVGNMGESILKALLKSGLPKNGVICSDIKTERLDAISKTYGIQTVTTPDELFSDTKYIFIAVKPQDSKELLKNIVPVIRDDQIIISIMAGITTSNILSTLGRNIKIIRIMPNVCVKVGEGVMGICTSQAVTGEEADRVKQIMAPLGIIIDVGENLMDAVTALGASSPAFFILFFEAMIDAGVKIGIPRDKSRIIAAQVVKGTLKMLEEEGLHPTLMREMITSPGGTTITGLAVLEERGFKGNIIKAIEESTLRSKELSQ